MMSYQKGLKDPSLDRHVGKAKSRHFTVNGLSANNTLQQQQYNLPPSNDTRNIYNNPYIPPQQQQQQQPQQSQQQRTAHLFKALAASATGSNSLTHPYDFSNSSSSSNANNELQGSSSSEADNAFLTHNNVIPRFRYINETDPSGRAQPGSPLPSQQTATPKFNAEILN
nr:signal transducer and activator of transcription A [Drosophila bipectinata]